MHQREMPPSILEDRADAPEDLVEICVGMMAKKPDDRPQSASEVAELMANWLTAHGHAFDSGSSVGGSSGKLAAAVAAAESESAAGGGRPRRQVRRPESARSVTPRHRGPRTEGDLRRAKPLPPVARGEGPGARDEGRGARDEGEDSDVRRQPAAAERIREKVDEEPERADVLDFLAREESPIVARLRSRHQVTTEELRAYEGHHKETPLWVWVVIGAGTLLALILLVVFVIGG
jgi:hypothetical protein